MKSDARRGRSLASYASLIVLASLFGCDVPTELPNWDTTWVIPGENSIIAVSSFLPAAATLAPGGTLFQMNLTPLNFSRTGADMCSACSAFNNQVAPKPDFTAEFDNNINLPASVLSFDLTSGQIDVVLNHNFSFDPLRPSASARGYLVITALRGTTVLAKDSINGQNVAFPPNVNLARSLNVSNVTGINGPIILRIRVSSPAGDPTLIDTNRRLNATATPFEMRSSGGVIQVTNRSVTSTSEDLSVEDIDEGIADRVKSGGLRLTTTNPFTVTGSISVTISAPGIQSIVRTIQIDPGTKAQRVVYSGAELRSILGREGVRLTVSGSITSPSSGTTVRPTDVISVATSIELTIGGSEN